MNYLKYWKLDKLAYEGGGGVLMNSVRMRIRLCYVRTRG